jgi:hypothetical protein
MRSALIGVCAESDAQLEELVRCSTRITHTDPKAEEAALLVARAAGLTVRREHADPQHFIEQAVVDVKGIELRQNLSAAAQALASRKTPAEYAAAQGWQKGISGYVDQTVPAALYCWADSPGDLRKCIEQAVLLGGDTDSVAAIAGAICGANLGSDSVPQDWLSRLCEWPRTVQWMQQLAESLATENCGTGHARVPSMKWLPQFPETLSSLRSSLLSVYGDCYLPIEDNQMNYVEAPNEYDGEGFAVFLAGSISDERNWQMELTRAIAGTQVTVLNPRRRKFPVGNRVEERRQIAWEHRHLERADLVVFWLAPPTLCPIALFELGVCCERGVSLAVGVDPEYVLRSDVGIQLSLRRPELHLFDNVKELARAVSVCCASEEETR